MFFRCTSKNKEILVEVCYTISKYIYIYIYIYTFYTLYTKCISASIIVDHQPRTSISLIGNWKVLSRVFPITSCAEDYRVTHVKKIQQQIRTEILN